MKKNNILIAKLSICIILLITGILGVFKLIDYLGKPMTLFYSSIDTIFSEIEYASNVITNDRMYTLIANNKIKMSGNADFEISGVTSLENMELQEKLEALNYLIQLEFDRGNKYFKNTLKVSRDNEELFEHIYIENDFLKTYKTSNEELYQKVTSDRVNIEFVNFSAINNINRMIREKISNTFLEENFQTRKQAINVNNQSVDCNVNYYEISGIELSTLIEFIFSEIKLNSEAVYYIADLFGIKGSEVNTMLASIKNSLNIDANALYTFEGYTRVNTDETVRFAIIEKKGTADASELFVINRSKGSISLEINKKEKLSLGITGYDNSARSIWLETGEMRYTLAFDKSSNKGRIVVTDLKSSKEVVTLEYNYSFEENDTVSIDITGECEKQIEEELGAFKVKTKLLLTTGGQIIKTPVSAHQLKDSTSDYGLDAYIDDILKNIEANSINDSISEPVLQE